MDPTTIRSITLSCRYYSAEVLEPSSLNPMSGELDCKWPNQKEKRSALELRSDACNASAGGMTSNKVCVAIIAKKIMGKKWTAFFVDGF